MADIGVANTNKQIDGTLENVARLYKKWQFQCSTPES
jgi:hypothetical protein